MSKLGYVASASGFCVAINAPAKKPAKSASKAKTTKIKK